MRSMMVALLLIFSPVPLSYSSNAEHPNPSSLSGRSGCFSAGQTLSLRGGAPIEDQTTKLSKRDLKRMSENQIRDYAAATGDLSAPRPLGPKTDIDIMHEKARKKLKKENHKLKEKRLMKLATSGTDKQMAQRAENVQQLILENKYSEFANILDPKFRAQEKMKKKEALRESRTKKLADFFEAEYRRRAKLGLGEMTANETLALVQKIQPSAGKKSTKGFKEQQLDQDGSLIEGWHNIKREYQVRKKERNILEMEDDEMTIPQRMRDWSKAKPIPGKLQQEYLEEAQSEGRFQFPPKPSSSEAVTDQCKRCSRLMLPQCFCTDAYGVPKVPTHRNVTGDTFIAQESDSSGDAAASGPVEVNYVWDDDTGVFTVLNHPLTPESRDKLNSSGEVPLIDSKENWPFTKYAWGSEESIAAGESDKDSMGDINSAFRKLQIGPREDIPKEFGQSGVISSEQGLAKALADSKSNGLSHCIGRGLYKLEGMPVLEWDKNTLLDPMAPRQLQGTNVSLQADHQARFLGQWLLTGKESTGCLKDLNTTFFVKRQSQDPEQLDPQSLLSDKAPTVFCCLGVNGGNWSLYDCSFLCDQETDSVRVSKSGNLALDHCQLGGINNQSKVRSALTLLHRSRVTLNHSKIFNTDKYAIRCLDNTRCLLDHCIFSEIGLMALELNSDAHLVQLSVLYEDECFLEKMKKCYVDKLPLYIPSRFCDWCAKWVENDLSFSVQDAQDEDESTFDPYPEHLRGEDTHELVAQDIPQRLGLWCVEDKDQNRFQNGKLPMYRPESGQDCGSVLGDHRPWCPPEVIQSIRRRFPNGFQLEGPGIGVEDPVLKEELFTQENLQALADGGFDLSGFVGADYGIAEDREDDLS